MRKLSVFNQVSVDGYFTDPNDDVSWTHRQDDEELREFVAANAAGGGVLVFGRKTYEMMASFWPTPAAAKQFPQVAAQMNGLPKIVFSKTLKKASWSHTRIAKDLVPEMGKLKSEPGEPLAILGSGSIVSQLTEAGLIDEYQVLVAPIVLGQGRTMFEGLRKMIDLKRTRSRPFRNGMLFNVYEPKRP